MVRTRRDEPLDQVQFLAVKIPSAIEPCLICEIHNIDNEDVALPVSSGISHPKIERPLWMWSSVRVNVSPSAVVLERDPYIIGRLENLERKRHIHNAGNTKQISLRIRIGRRAILEILPLLRKRLGPVRKLVAFDNALAAGHAEPCWMVLDIPCRRVQYLPDALQVWFPVGHAGQSRTLRVGRCRQSEEKRRSQPKRERLSHVASLLVTSRILCKRRSRSPRIRRTWRDPWGLFPRPSRSGNPRSGRSRAAAALPEDRACAWGTPSSRLPSFRNTVRRSK